MAWSEKLSCLVAGTFSGLLLISSFPAWGKSYLAWIALIPLLWLLRKAQTMSCFYTGFWTGAVFFCGLLYWLSDTMMRFGGIPPILSRFLLLILCLYLGSYFGVFSILLKHIYHRVNLPFCIVAPTLWVALEFARSHILTGFPWGLLGYSQAGVLNMIQLADITGIYGISFLIVLLNAGITDLAGLYIDSIYKRDASLKLVKEAVALGLILILVAVYGNWRIGSKAFGPDPGKGLDVSIIQGNISQEIKRDLANSYDIIDEHGTASLRMINEPDRLIVWPETACTATVLAGEGAGFHFLSEWARQIGSHLLLGCTRYDMERQGLFNSAVFLSNTGDLKGFYDKIHLVPFGEYFPFMYIGKILGDPGSFLSGNDFKIFNLNGNPFGVIICFEAIFPDLCRRFVRNGAGFLVNLTNDAWYGRTAAPYQHFDMARIRSVENRIWLVRSANTGISAFVDPAGRVVKRGGIFEKLALDGIVITNHEKSFYTISGDVFAWLCLFISALWCAFAIIRLIKGESGYV